MPPKRLGSFTSSIGVGVLFFLLGCASQSPKSNNVANSGIPTSNGKSQTSNALPKATAPRVISAVPGEESDSRAITFRDSGYQYYQRSDFPRAIQTLEASLLMDPQGSELWTRYLLFYCYLTTGDYRSAQKYAEEIVRLDPYQSLAYLQMGLVQLWMGQGAAAVENFQRALEFEAHPPRVHFYAGLAHQQNKNNTARDKAFDLAIDEYQQILKANPKDFAANFELAYLYLFWNRELEKASLLVNAARESVTSSPDEDLSPDRKLSSQYYLPLLEGILYFRTGNPQQALAALYHALSNAPSGSKADVSEIYFFLGSAYLQQQEKATARVFLTKAATLDPFSPYQAELQKAMHDVASRP